MIYSSPMGWQDAFDTWLESGSGSPHHPNPEQDAEQEMEDKAAEQMAIGISQVLDNEVSAWTEFKPLVEEIDRDILSNGSVSAGEMAEAVAKRLDKAVEVLETLAKHIREDF